MPKQEEHVNSNSQDSNQWPCCKVTVFPTEPACCPRNELFTHSMISYFVFSSIFSHPYTTSLASLEKMTQHYMLKRQSSESYFKSPFSRQFRAMITDFGQAKTMQSKTDGGSIGYVCDGSYRVQWMYLGHLLVVIRREKMSIVTTYCYNICSLLNILHNSFWVC